MVLEDSFELRAAESVHGSLCSKLQPTGWLYKLFRATLNLQVHMAAHPWLEPLYRRVLTLAVCVAWLVYELFQQEPFWLLMAGTFTGYAVWDFFLSGNYRK